MTIHVPLEADATRTAQAVPATEPRAESAVPRLHLLVDAPGTPGGPRDLDQLASVVATGVDGVQVRAKHLTDRDLTSWSRRVLETVRSCPGPVTVVVDDRVDVALAAGADGVHLGRDDLPVADARRIAPHLLIGATARSATQAGRLAARGADYVGVGPLWPSRTKAGLPDPLDHDELRRAATLAPCIGIAGIDVDRVPTVMGLGAHGVAVSAAVWGSTDPPAAAAALVREVRDRSVR